MPPIAPEEAPPGYAAWLSELRRLAQERELEWLVCTGPNAHRAAFDQGLSPGEELGTLHDMSQWRGCGCGGSA
jgi:hypothetical protein